jgi:type II pantothenate kinase
LADPHAHSMHDAMLPNRGLLPAGTAGIDAGMTLTKVAVATADTVKLSATETRAGAHPVMLDGTAPARTGVTGALLGALVRDGVVRVQEIEAGARGASALLRSEDRLGDGEFLLALIGTGTAFAAVRGDSVQHLGGTPMGGGSFAGIARRVDASLKYDAMITGAERGDRRRVDTMISDVYPDGIGRVGPDLTAAHLQRATEGSLDDFLAGLLNMHGENIAQIAAGRANMARTRRLVLAGGFVHNNRLLVASMTQMGGLFGLDVEVAPSPGYAGALGAALAAAARSGKGAAT